MKIFKEFKEFIAQGNAIDLAVGVVIGGAFKAIVDALVNYIIMPFIAFLGTLLIKGASTVGADGLVSTMSSFALWTIPGTEIAIGLFISSIINFLIVAFVLFCVIKGLNRMREIAKKKEEAEAAPAGPTQEELLAEIRDLLKEKND
ncbi:MAG: large conductance mechanosensitive channel protein MscL [Oscillospiraceae bacterium]|nr:large conductance mechanosensitive channel protein MscL [Oscillospiraceae bacterium]